jgi:pimeloyl-ACP methyl ester carboxylesterase
VDAGNGVYALDLLGFGASSTPGDVTVSMELYVQLAIDFIQVMRTNRVFRKWQTSRIVVANSIDGLIRLGAAEKLSKLVRGV